MDGTHSEMAGRHADTNQIHTTSDDSDSHTNNESKTLGTVLHIKSTEV